MTRAEAVTNLRYGIKNCFNRNNINPSRPYHNTSDNLVRVVEEHDPFVCPNCSNYLAQFVVDMLKAAASERLTNGG